MIDAVVPFHLNSEIRNIELWNMDSRMEFQFKLVHDSFLEECRGQCTRLLRIGSNIEVICGRFGSPGLARNAGKELCRNEWLVFLDSDDIPNFDLISKIQRDAAREGCNAFVGGFSEISSNGRSIESDKLSREKFNMILAIKPGLWRFGFSNKLIKSIHFTHHRWGEDQLFLLNAVSKSEFSTYVADECIYEYRNNGTNQISKNSRLVSDLAEVLQIEYSEYSHCGNRQVEELYDYLAMRQILTIIKYSGVRNFKTIIVKALLSPFSISRLRRKIFFFFYIVSRKLKLKESTIQG